MSKKIKLEMNFMDSNGKNFKLSIDDPIDNLNKEKIKPICNTIIENNVFTNKGASLVSISKVNKVTTTTEEIEL